MLFLLVARMRKSPEAAALRERLRPQQLETVRAMAARGTMRIGGALLDPARNVAGSMAILDFASRAELDAWIADHPYRTNGVWGEIEMWSVQPAPAFAEGEALGKER